MPGRMMSVAILGFWLVAAASLVTRDILPGLIVGDPPDLRSIVRAEDADSTARWAIQVADGHSADGLRSVGRAVTVSRRGGDGSLRLRSDVRFDAAGLLRGTPFAERTGVKYELEVASRYEIDPSGNLKSFRVDVRPVDEDDDLVALDGRVEGGALVVEARGSLPMMNWTRSFDYRPRSLMQSALGPLDRLPGLRVGQRWETRVVNPLTGRFDTARAEVARHELIHWGKDTDPVKTLVVVHQMSPLSARTWVRPDGLVLRQEVPFPFVKLVLERLPEPARPASVAGPGAGGEPGAGGTRP